MFSGRYVIYRVSSIKRLFYIQTSRFFAHKKMKAAQISKPDGPLHRVAEAYEQMHSGKARFRVVLTMGE